MSLDPARYAELFRTESREQLSAINRALLLLEQGGDPAEPVGAIFRAVHTVKGMSATMGYRAIAWSSPTRWSRSSTGACASRGAVASSPELMDAAVRRR